MRKRSTIAPRRRIRRTRVYKVIWYCKYTAVGPSGPRGGIEFKNAMVRTQAAAFNKLLEWGLPGHLHVLKLIREKHCGSAKTKEGIFWRSASGSLTFSATPYRIE